MHKIKQDPAEKARSDRNRYKMNLINRNRFKKFYVDDDSWSNPRKRYVLSIMEDGSCIYVSGRYEKSFEEGLMFTIGRARRYNETKEKPVKW